MVDVSTSTIIAEPLQKVAAYVFDPEHAPQWYVNIKSVEWKTAKPLRLNSQIVFVARFLGKSLTYTYKVTELSQTRMVMETSEGPFPMETTYQLDEIDAKTTRMTLRNRGNPSGFSKIAAPFISMMMRRANRQDLARLKTALGKSSR